MENYLMNIFQVNFIIFKLQEKKPGETLKLAVKRMLPGGVLGRKQLTKLKIYAGSDHPHTAQNPQVIELGKLNSKNLVRN